MLPNGAEWMVDDLLPSYPSASRITDERKMNVCERPDSSRMEGSARGVSKSRLAQRLSSDQKPISGRLWKKVATARPTGPVVGALPALQLQQDLLESTESTSQTLTRGAPDELEGSEHGQPPRRNTTVHVRAKVVASLANRTRKMARISRPGVGFLAKHRP